MISDGGTLGQVEDLKLFVDVIEQGSISKAAQKLNIAKSAVSRKINILEDRYNAILINRTPGKWEVTKIGLELYQRSRDLITDFEEIHEDFTSSHAQISGPLTVSIPRDFGLCYLSDKLIQFKEKYPNIKLTADFDDRLVNLETENYDFAIRITPKPDHTLIHASIGTIARYLCASPEYLRMNGTPHTLEELKSHSLLHYGTTKRGSWTFETKGSEEKSLKFSPSFSSNSGQFLGKAVLQHQGICILPDFIAKEHIKSGKMLVLLPELTPFSYAIYLVHSSRQRLNRRMRAFITELSS